MRTTPRIAAVAAGFALTFGATAATGTAVAAPGGPAGCTQQQKQVDKAEDALERLTAVFQAQQDRVKEAKGDVREADSKHERVNAKRDLAQAKEKRAKVQKTKKAQVQRLAKAQERLEKCQATQPQGPETPETPEG